MPKGENTRDFRLPVNTGVKPDGFAEDVALIDINNYVLLPDGSALAPRNGSEIRRVDIAGVGVARKTIFFVSEPPDISYANMICIVANKDGRRVIENSELVEKADLPSAPEIYTGSTFDFDDTTITYDGVDYTQIGYTVNRTGNIAASTTVKIKTVNGTAIGGVDFTAIDTTLSFASFESTKSGVIVTEATSANLGKEFTLELYSPGTAARLGTATVATADMGESTSAYMPFMYITDSNDINVLFYDATTEQVAGPATLTGGATGGVYTAFRTENYFVSFRSNVAQTHAKLMAWSIPTIRSTPTGTYSADVSVDVFEHLTPLYAPTVYAYAGDIVFVIADADPGGTHDWRLYKVDLVAGTVSDAAITGLPSFSTVAGSTSYLGGVDANGDLWLSVNTVNNDIVKVNPATSVATYESSPYELSTFSPRSDGSMVCYTVSDGKVYVVNNACTTFTELTGVDWTLTDTVYDMQFMGLSTIYRPTAGNNMQAYDGDAGAAVGSVKTTIGDVNFPQSAFEGTHMVMVAYDGEPSVIHLYFFNPTTGAIDTEITTDATFQAYSYEDFFAYRLLNVQGSRL